MCARVSRSLCVFLAYARQHRIITTRLQQHFACHKSCRTETTRTYIHTKKKTLIYTTQCNYVIINLLNGYASSIRYIYNFARDERTHEIRILLKVFIYFLIYLRVYISKYEIEFLTYFTQLYINIVCYDDAYIQFISSQFKYRNLWKYDEPSKT